MKNYILFVFLTLSVMAVDGQNIYFGLGKTIAKLKFNNTEGTSLQGLKGSNENTFYLGGRYPLAKTAMHLSADVAYQQYYAQGSDPVQGNYYSWDTKFLGLNFGFDYELFKPNFAFYKKQAFSVCLKASAGTEFLINGIQNVNNQLTSLKGADEYDRPFYFARGGISVNFYFSKELFAFAQYLGGRSILIGEYTNKQQAFYITHSITFGVSYNFAYSNVSTR
jgi:hypothetical protein